MKLNALYCVDFRSFEEKKMSEFYTCSHCHLTRVEMSRCSRCEKQRYCSRVCQQNDWSEHKKVCAPPGVVCCQKISGSVRIPEALFPNAKHGDKMYFNVKENYGGDDRFKNFTVWN